MRVFLFAALLCFSILEVVTCANVFKLPEDAVLPQGVTPEMVIDAGRSALKRALGKLYSNFQDESRRNLQEELPDFECNSLIGTLSRSEFQQEVRRTFEEDVGLEGLELLALEFILIQRLTEGFQAWKVCASCAEFEGEYGSDRTACFTDDYGYSATVSGVLLVPYDTLFNRVIPRTRPVNVLLPAAGSVPSLTWQIPFVDPLLLISGIWTSSSSAYTLLPDYIGWGESHAVFSTQDQFEAAEYKRAFTVYKSVASATLPLITKSEKMISEMTNCQSAMADAYAIWGYSEGGYAAPVIADMLDKMGKTIIALHAGGGPFRLSSEQIKFAVDLWRTPGARFSKFFASIAGAGYSTTVTDASNFGDDQDFLSDTYRLPIITAANCCPTRDRNNPDCCDVTFTNAELFPNDEPLNVINPSLRALMIKALDENIAEPCQTETDLAAYNPPIDKLCAALVENDVIGVVEEATYPVYLCHTNEDELVSYGNLPDQAAFDKNPNLNLLTVSGDHSPEGALSCLIDDAIPYWTDPNNVKNFPVEDKSRLLGCARVCLFRIFGTCLIYV